MAHEWHTEQSKNPLTLINEFKHFRFKTDYGGEQEVSRVIITRQVFSNHGEAITFVTNRSYCGDAAYLAAYTTKKLSKGYQKAFENFVERYDDYLNFENNLTIAYGRTSSKATCPNCESSISLKYGKKLKACPVCGSSKIISDSNWKMLDAKLKRVEKAAENLSNEAGKNDVMFVCGFEWHC